MQERVTITHKSENFQGSLQKKYLTLTYMKIPG